MQHHRKAWKVAAGTAALAALAACAQDKGPHAELGPRPSPSAEVGGTLTKRIRLLGADGSVWYESSEDREVAAILARGVARADSGPLLAMMTGIPLQANVSSWTDSAGRRYEITTTGPGLPGSASLRQDGREVARISFAWTSFGDLDVLTERTTTVFAAGRPLAEERSTYRPSRVPLLSESARAEQLSEWRRQPDQPFEMIGCGSLWGGFMAASVELNLALAAYNIFGEAAAGFVQSAASNYASSILTLVVCLYGM